MKIGIYILSLFILVISFAGCKKYGYKFNEGYTKGSENSTAVGGSDADMKNDFSKLDAAKYFPGLVDAGEPRLSNYPVSIDLSQKYVYNYQIKVISTPGVLHSTGMYAPAGEVITIEVPEGVNWLTAQIGGWTDVLSGAALKRDAVIFNAQQLKPGKNYMRNLYGGSVYITFNAVTIRAQQSITLKFSGTVKSPDFVLGETSDATWNSAVKASSVPWVQLRGKRVIFELPKFMFDQNPVDNPTELMREWDRIIDLDIYKWKGLDDVTSDSLDKAPELPVRVIMDVQPSSGYAHIGYPVVIQMDQALFNSITNLNLLKTQGSWRTMSEIGRNFVNYYWTWSYISSTAADFYSLKMANRNQISYAAINPNMTDAVNTGLAYIDSKKLYNANFYNDAKNFKNAELVKLVPFMQLFDIYGYGLITYVDDKARHYFRETLSDQEKINLFYLWASEYAKVDLSPFFTAWAIYLSPATQDSVHANFDYLQKDIYHYNPITKTGGNSAVPPPTKFIDRTIWKVIDVCCEEIDATGKTFPASNILDGNDLTYWKTKTTGVDASTAHFNHFVSIDMGKYVDIDSVWFVHPVINPTFNPQNISIFVSVDKQVWTQALTVTGWNNVGIFNKAVLNPKARNVRYIMCQINKSFNTANNIANTIVEAEFGAIRP